MVRSGCGLLLSFCHNFTIIHLSVHAPWVSLFHQGGWMAAFCRGFVVWAGLRARSFDITPMSDLPYWNGYWSFRFCSIPGFCRLKTTGRWPLPCDARVSARVHGTSFGDTSARSIVLSVSPCHVPGCVGLAVDTGVKRTSLSAASSAHPCWLVPCWSHRLDHALKSPHIIIVSPSSSSISSRKSQLAPVMQVEGWMYALMRIRDLCLSSGFPSGCPAIRVSLWTTYPSSVRILSCWDCSGLLLPYHGLHASGWLWSLEAPVVDLGMSLFLVDIPHQSRRPSSPGQRLVCWHLHNSMSILWSTSWTACLLFSFYTSGRRVLICVFRLSFSVSVGLGLGILIDVSSPVHDPHCAGEILF